MTKLAALFSLIGALAFAAPALAQDEPRLALLIGNQDYPGDPPRLRRPHDDVATLGAALERAEFEVVRVLDADAGEIEDAVAAFGERLREAGPSAVGFFYYAGHGAVANAQGARRNFILPAGVEISSATAVAQRGVRLDRQIDALESAGAATLFVVYDACRNSFSRGDRGFTVETARPGILVAMSTMADATTPDDGAYAVALAGEITRPGQPALLAFSRASQLVGRGRPSDELPTVSPALREEFCFLTCAGDAEPPPIDEDLAAWERATSEGSAEALQAYLDAQPEGRFRASAELMVAALSTPTTGSEEVADGDAASSVAERLGMTSTAESLLEELGYYPPSACSVESDNLDAVESAMMPQIIAQFRTEERNAAELEERGLRYVYGPYFEEAAPLLRSSIVAFRAAESLRLGGAINRELIDALSAASADDRRCNLAENWAAARALDRAMNAGEQPRTPENLDRLSRYYLATFHLQHAIEPLEQAAQFSADGEMLALLGELYLIDQRYAEASTALTSALGRGVANRARVFLLLGAARFDEMRFDAAIAAFRESERLGDEDEAFLARTWRLRAESSRAAREEPSQEAPSANAETDHAARTPGTVFRDCSTCPEMVVIPPGTFIMGTDGESEGTSERPAHRVNIATRFAAGRYEVSRREFQEFVAATDHELRADCSTARGSNNTDAFSLNFDQTDDHPIVCVRYADAIAYTEWLAERTGQPYRLLTEAEWEYAARAGDERNDIPLTCDNDDANGANTFVCGVNGTAPVGSFSPNRFGLHDMHGNVAEFVIDCWHWDYYTGSGPPSDGSAWMETGSPNAGCGSHMIRGSSWASSRNLRVTQRYGLNDSYRGSDGRGFRVARDLE